MFSIKNWKWTQKLTVALLRLTVIAFLAGVAISFVADFRGLEQHAATLSARSDRTESLPTPIYEFALSPDRQQILCRCNYQQILLRDCVTGSQIAAFDFHANRPRTIAHTSVDNTFLVGYDDGSLVLWSTEAGDDQYGPQVLGRHDSATLTCAVSSDLRLAASGHADGFLNIWDARNGSRLQSIQAHRDEIKCVRFSADARRVLSASADICVWDVETGKAIAKLVGHTGNVRSAAFSPNGDRVVSGDCYNGTVRLWDVASETELWQVKVANSVYSVAYSPDGKLVAVGETCIVSLWDAQTYQQVAELNGHTVPVTGLTFSDDAKQIYSASVDGTVRVWDISTGMELQRLW